MFDFIVNGEGTGSMLPLLYCCSPPLRFSQLQHGVRDPQVYAAKGACVECAPGWLCFLYPRSSATLTLHPRSPSSASISSVRGGHGRALQPHPTGRQERRAAGVWLR